MSSERMNSQNRTDQKCSCPKDSDFKIKNSRCLHTMIVQFVILVWRGFNHVKILDWNINKSASRLYINAPKVE